VVTCGEVVVLMSLLEQLPHSVPQSSFKHEDDRVNQNYKAVLFDGFILLFSFSLRCWLTLYVRFILLLSMERLLHSLLSKQLIFIYYLQPFSKYSLKCFCKDKLRSSNVK